MSFRLNRVPAGRGLEAGLVPSRCLETAASSCSSESCSRSTASRLVSLRWRSQLRMERNGVLRLMVNLSFQTGAGLAEQFQFRAVEACAQAATGTRLFDDTQFYHGRRAHLDNPACAQTYSGT